MCTVVDAEEIFRRWFWDRYPEDARVDLARARTTDANPANNPSVTAHLVEAAELFANRFGVGFGDADVRRVSALVGPEQRDAWAQAGNREGSEESDELFHVVVHGVAWLGECVGRTRGGVWRVRRPLWESLVALRSHAGEAELALFQWWLKALAGGATLADRYHAYVEVPTANVDALPSFVPADRKLPRIAKGVRYDVLHRHLKAHLPELRDLGADFPTAERFAEMRFRWLDFVVVGGGRMVLAFGPGEGGLHLIWLGSRGFEKAAFVPCDATLDPIVRVDGDKVIAIALREGKTVAHEMLWWGP